MAALLQGPATRQDFDLYAGRDYVLSIPTVNNEDGSPYVFESDTKVYWWLGLDKTNPLVEKVSTDPAQIAISGNTVSVRIKNSDTVELKASASGRVYMHELEIIDPDGNKFTACVGNPTVYNVFDQNPAVFTGTKVYSYDFIATPVMSPRLYLTRSTVGTYIDTSGTRTTAAINAPRFENRWNGSTWAPAGLLVEPAGSQFATTSEVFNTNPGFTNYAISLNVSSTKGANNTDFMRTLLADVYGTVGAYVIRSSTGQTGSFFASVDVKLTNWNYAFITNNDNNLGGNHNWCYAVFDLTTGLISDTKVNGAVTTATTYVRRLRNNIYRIMLIGGNPNGVNTEVGIAQHATGNTASTNYGEPQWSPLPAGTETILIGGVTFSAADYETSHIPSSGAVATRGADVLMGIGMLPSELAAGPSVWEMTDLVTGTTSRTSFAAGAFTFPTKKLYRSFAVYTAGTDTSPFMTVGGPY